MEFSRPEYWSGQPFPSPGNLPKPGIEPRSPAMQADSLPGELSGKPKNIGVGIFPTWELNQGLLHCRQILYQLSYQGSPIKDRVDFNNTANRLICVVLSFLIMTPPCCFPISLRSLFEGLFFLIQFIASLAPPWSTDLKQPLPLLAPIMFPCCISLRALIIT